MSLILGFSGGIGGIIILTAVCINRKKLCPQPGTCYATNRRRAGGRNHIHRNDWAIMIFETYTYVRDKKRKNRNYEEQHV